VDPTTGGVALAASRSPPTVLTSGFESEILWSSRNSASVTRASDDTSAVVRLTRLLLSRRRLSWRALCPARARAGCMW